MFFGILNVRPQFSIFVKPPDFGSFNVLVLISSHMVVDISSTMRVDHPKNSYLTERQFSHVRFLDSADLLTFFYLLLLYFVYYTCHLRLLRPLVNYYN